MLRGPQHVEAELVHELGDVARREESFRQPLVGIAPLVGRRAIEAHIVELDLADIEDMEFLDHVVFPGLAIPWRPCRGVKTSRGSQPPSRHVCDGYMSVMDICNQAGCGLMNPYKPAGRHGVALFPYDHSHA